MKKDLKVVKSIKWRWRVRSNPSGASHYFLAQKKLYTYRLELIGARSDL
jgi:hypothetical protein